MRRTTQQFFFFAHVVALLLLYGALRFSDLWAQPTFIPETGFCLFNDPNDPYRAPRHSSHDNYFLRSINTLSEENNFGLSKFPYVQIQLSEAQFNSIKEKLMRAYTFTVRWEDYYEEAHPNMGGYVSMGGGSWYGVNSRFNKKEEWPIMAEALENNGIPLPAWSLGPCPWADKWCIDEVNTLNSSFGLVYYHDIQVLEQSLSTDPKALDVFFRFGAWKNFLNFLNSNFHASDHSAVVNLTPEESLLVSRLKAVATVYDSEGRPLGLYALVDYNHWQKEQKERSNISPTQHWGLQSVLQNMDPKEIEGAGALNAFVNSALNTVHECIRNTEMELDRNNTPIPNDKYDPNDDPKSFWPCFESHVRGYLTW